MPFITRAFQQRVTPLLLHAALRRVAHLYLLDDDRALFVDLLRIEGQCTRPVAHNPSTGVKKRSIVRRHCRETVDGLVLRRRGIDVMTVHDAMPLEGVNHALTGEMLGALEGEVLQEMGNTVLFRFLRQGSDVVHKGEVGLTRHLGVTLEVIGDTVGQRALDIRLRACCHQQGRQKQEA